MPLPSDPTSVPCALDASSPSRKTRKGMAAPFDTGPMTRLTSRARNWKAIRPPASAKIEACWATVQLRARDVNLVERQTGMAGVRMRSVERRVVRGREAGGLEVAEVGLR